MLAPRAALLDALSAVHFPVLLAALLMVTAAPWLGVAVAHPGTLDEFGGHFDSETRVYHYHKPPRDMALRKRESLQWVRFPIAGIVKGRAVEVGGSRTLWLRVDYRPTYQELAQYVALANRDDEKQWLRVDLSHVSPEETGAQNKRFEAWFRERVTEQLQARLTGAEVSVHFELIGGQAARLRGLVFNGEENVNLWLVLNGWSYYVLADGPNAYDELFRQAEDIARKQKAGIWQHLR